MQIRLVVGIAVAFPDCSPILSRRKIVSDIVHELSRATCWPTKVDGWTTLFGCAELGNRVADR
jgi:hypothetical protein